MSINHSSFIRADDYDDDDNRHGRIYRKHGLCQCGATVWILSFILAVTVSMLVIQAVFTWGMKENAPMMIKTSDATVDMHARTSRMQDGVTNWLTGLRADWPADQDKIWLSRADKLTKDSAELVRKANLAILVDDLKTETLIPLIMKSAMSELVEPETVQLLNKKAREALMFMQPHEIAESFKSFNKAVAFAVDIQKKGVIDRAMEMIEDGDMVFKGMVAYFNQPRKSTSKRTKKKTKSTTVPLISQPKHKILVSEKKKEL